MTAFYAKCPMPTGEAAIVELFRMSAAATSVKAEDRIPFDQEADTVVYEMPLRYGRADIVIFHIDGSVSIIEAKDGGQGYMHVMRGIGQVGMYAVQFAFLHAKMRRVRRCLLWTSTGDLFLDTLIEEACNQAGVIPLPWGRLKDHMPQLVALHAAV